MHQHPKARTEGSTRTQYQQKEEGRQHHSKEGDGQVAPCEEGRSNAAPPKRSKGETRNIHKAHTCTIALSQRIFVILFSSNILVRICKPVLGLSFTSEFIVSLCLNSVSGKRVRLTDDSIKERLRLIGAASSRHKFETHLTMLEISEKNMRLKC